MKEFYQNQFKSIIDFKNYEIVFRDYNNVLYDSIFEKLDYQSIFLTSNFLNYQLEYQSFNQKVYDLSFVLLNDKNPIGIFVFFVVVKAQKITFSSSLKDFLFQPIYLNDKFDINKRKKTNKHIFNSLNDFGRKNNTSHYFYRNIFDGIQDNQYLTELYKPNFISDSDFQLDMFIDTSLSPDSIFKDMKKSLKYDIKKGPNFFKYEIYENVNKSLWDKFKSLHYKQAGRMTRSDRSWEIQFDSFALNRAILICIYKDSKLVGASYFSLTKDEIMYSVAAYERSLFKYPLAHNAIFMAIEYAFSNNLKSIYLGPIIFGNDKETSITNFKKSFANMWIVSPIIKVKIRL